MATFPTVSYSLVGGEYVVTVTLRYESRVVWAVDKSSVAVGAVMFLQANPGVAKGAWDQSVRKI